MCLDYWFAAIGLPIAGLFIPIYLAVAIIRECIQRARDTRESKTR